MIASNDCFYIREKLIMFFENDFILRQNLDNESFCYLEKYFNKKVNSKFSWGAFSFLLNNIFSSKNLLQMDISYGYAGKLYFIELFIMATDFLDDLMDKDNIEFEALQEKKYFVSFMLEYSLSKLLNYFKLKKQKDVFINNLNSSLTSQIVETESKISINSCEKFYYSNIVNRSFFLMNSIIQISGELPALELMIFSYFFSIAAQIKNDIYNILGDQNSDVINKKPTLPIIKVLDFSKTKDNSMLYKILYEYINDSGFNDYNKIRNLIIDYGILEYCNFISNKCYKYSINYLVTKYPQKNRQINEMKCFLENAL